ncbi:serine/threonine protein kinase [Streptomyces armeniacus]|uniref:non-specific serine/threonine protein kinase n=1 Tax=Streptomyces armeniacus TaxID=83291 RepID=A0A345XPC0_9ACTN|nr:serine/threonine-protein kinase [Streptomyces armeniacus]AXK33486.1 serine/threonine protein kinase [Streptomyces armeniacus]
MGEIFAGRYELVDPIGRGGAGEVWRSWDHRRKRYVAAKVLQQSDAHTLLRFVREQALRIDHPHVLAPASWAADDDKVLFTMDLVSGGSLAHLIGDYGPLPPSFVCVLLDQLLAGLTAVHAEDVVHRDIKPANILLEPTGTGRPHVRLSDFGISMRKGEPRLTETNYVVGTPGYFAPEQMMGAEPDFTADLFAVGLVGLFMLSGQKPDSMELMERFKRGGVQSPPERVPEPLWQVLGTLLQPDPQNRFRTATGARKALAGAAEMLGGDGTLEQEVVEVFDHLGPLPQGFGPDGPVGGSAPPAAAAPAGAPAGTPPYGQGQVQGTGQGTDSFHLPPPQGAFGGPPPEQPATPPSAPPAAPPVTPPPASGAPDTPATPTRPYDPYGARQAPAAPVAATGPATPTGPATQAAAAYPGGAGAPAPVRRPGPPPKVAIPVLIVAVICLAVGVWALTAS